MGSMATIDVTNTNNDIDSIVPKLEPLDDALTPDSESGGSSPEDSSAILIGEGDSLLQEPAPVPKRKGGRKPVSID